MNDDVDQMSFGEEVGRPGGPRLAVAALLLARELAYPDMRPTAYLARIASWAEAAQARCAPDASLLERATCLSDLLFDQIGLRGNATDYYDPRNSFLNEVIDRRLGLPITLSAIYLEVASQIGLPAYGLGLPGHFVVAVSDDASRWLLDPFHGGQPITADEAAALVRKVSGYKGSLRSEWLQPLPVEAILARILNNLREVYVRQEDWPQTMAVIERLRVVQPRAAEHVRDLGVLHYRTGSLRQAAQRLEEYLLRAPDAPDASAVRNSLNALLKQLARLN